MAFAFLAVSSSMLASASIESRSTCSDDFIEPSAFVRDTPRESKASDAPATPFAVPSKALVMLTMPFFTVSIDVPLRSMA